MADGVDVFTYISDHTEAVLRSVVPDRTCFTRLSPGVDPGLFAAPKRHGPDRAHRGPVIVCVARLVRRKGQDALIRAMPMIHDRHPGTRLVLVGDGPRRRDLQALARRLGVTDVVTFVGGLPHSWIPAVLAASDIFAMPCRTRRAGFEEEGLGIVFLEASAAGLPVIAGNSGGAPETVRAGATGLVTANDAELSKLCSCCSTTPMLRPEWVAPGGSGRRVGHGTPPGRRSPVSWSEPLAEVHEVDHQLRKAYLMNRYVASRASCST